MLSDTFRRDLWYFSDILDGLCYFDDRIGADLRNQIVANLPIPASDESVKRLDSSPEPLSTAGLASCVTQRTAVIFYVLCMVGKTKAQNFLVKDPREWNDDPF